MLKIKIIACLVFCVGFNAFAQNLTPKEKAVFDDIAYKRMQVGNYEVINKWAVPIRYQVFGDVPDYLLKEIDSTFNQIKALTALDIKRTTDNDEANFLIVLGTKDINMLSKNMLKYLNTFGGHYYRTNKKSEIIRVECFLNAEKYSNRMDIRAALKKNLIKCIGFFKTTDSAPSSLFYSASNTKLKIDAFDSHIISAMYLPTIKAGMTKEEVDAILK